MTSACFAVALALVACGRFAGVDDGASGDPAADEAGTDASADDAHGGPGTIEGGASTPRTCIPSDGGAYTESFDEVRSLADLCLWYTRTESAKLEIAAVDAGGGRLRASCESNGPAAAQIVMDLGKNAGDVAAAFDVDLTTYRYVSLAGFVFMATDGEGTPPLANDRDYIVYLFFDPSDGGKLVLNEYARSLDGGELNRKHDVGVFAANGTAVRVSLAITGVASLSTATVTVDGTQVFVNLAATPGSKRRRFFYGVGWDTTDGGRAIAHYDNLELRAAP